MLRIDRLAGPPLMLAVARAFAGFVHGVFEHRRKTLRAALGFVVENTKREQLARIMDLQIRPEQVPPEQWVRMFTEISR